MSDLNKADEEIMRLATADDDAPDTETKPEPKAAEPKAAEPDDTLELGSEDEATPEQVEEEEKRKGRSHSPIQRINTLTARLREAERRNAELEAKAAPTQEAEAKAPDANDAKYEFGMADPQYIKDAALFEVRSELAKEAKAKEEESAKSAEQNKLVSRLNEGVANVEKAGLEKYDDFEKVIGEALEAREGPLPPLVSIGIAVSPAGADIAYHLAKNADESAKLEELAQTKPQAAAVAFGELEGQYLDDDSDLDVSDPMDMARMLGRMKSRLAGKKAGTVERKTTKAPPPPDNRARGSTGQFTVDDDTEDFRSFEKKYSK